MGLFNNREKDNGREIVPVWFMRQAGRYHQHYQNIKKDSDFMTMCKDPILAQKITHGPIDEFDFDAAILFSDLLFPLEQLSMGLNYRQGPPRLEFHLSERDNFKKLKELAPATEFYQFQKEACSRLRQSLPANKTLLGFAGAPFTLYTYAMEGGHSGSLSAAKTGLYRGDFQHFCELLYPNLIEELSLQAQGGADGLCLFDTASGELSFDDYKTFVIPEIKKISKELKTRHPDVKIVYYSKMTHLNYLQAIEDENIDVLGIDWRVDIGQALQSLSQDYYIQGNLDPTHLHLPWELLEKKWDELWQKVQNSGVAPARWICGLGHGVLQHTPESNVLNSVKYIHRHFRY